MEQTLINISIAVGTILILIIPLYILSKNSAKQKEANLINRFNIYCTQNSLQVTDRDVIRNKVFGHDPVKNKLALVFTMGNAEEEYMIDLNKSSNAAASKISSKNGGDEIWLSYLSNVGKKQEILFYRHFRDNENDLTPLLNKAESLSSLINKAKP